MKKKFCSECGNKYTASSKFCANCGKSTELHLVNAEQIHLPSSRKLHKNFWIAVFVFFIILAILGYAGSRRIDAGTRDNAAIPSVRMGERFSIKPGESVLIEEVKITDVIDVSRRIWIKIDYSKPSLDSLEVALYNTDRKVADVRINGQGVMEYMGIPWTDARNEYSLVFRDGRKIKLDKYQYTEAADPFNTSISDSPQTNDSDPQSEDNTPRNLSCSSSNLGDSTFTNCYQY